MKYKILTFFTALLFLSNSLFSQMLPDNISDAECFVLPPAQTWGITSTRTVAENLSTYQVPIVGDIDGDGIAEIIVGGDIIISGTLVTKIYIYKGNDLSLPPKSFNTVSPFIWGMQTKYSIGKTKTGGVETVLIVVAESDLYLRAYDHNGTLLWTSDTQYHGTTSSVSPIFADVDKDGIPEIVVNGRIFNSTNGKLLCSTAANGYTFVANLFDTQNLNILVGNRIYQPNATLTSAPLIRTINQTVHPSDPDYPGAITIPTGGRPVVADMDKDGKLDLIISYNSGSSSFSDYTFISISDPETGVIKASKYIPDAGVSTYPFIGDIDGDGLPEIVFIKNLYSNYGRGNGSSETAGDSQYCQILAYKYIPGDPILQEFWSYQHYDYSGQTGMTLFDFNLDGISEIVYRDEWNLRIINGSGKHHITGLPVAPYNLASFPNHSGTSQEFPTIADVDGDGQAEILVVGAAMNNNLVNASYFEYSGSLWVFKSDDPTNNPWAPARKVWNQHMYNVVNINEDLTVPKVQFNPATIFAGEDGILGTPDDIQPFNNFLQQQTILSGNGTPLWLAANAQIAGTPTFTYNEVADEMEITLQVKNVGDIALLDPFYVTAYKDIIGGSSKHTYRYESIIAVGETVTISFSVPNFQTWIPYHFIILKINDRGDGNDDQRVCDSSASQYRYYGILPTQQDVCAGKVKEMTCSFNLSSNDTYQWQSSKNNVTWTDISGATAVSYTPANQKRGVIYYRVVVTNNTDTETVNSESVRLKVRSCLLPVNHNISVMGYYD